MFSILKEYWTNKIINDQSKFEKIPSYIYLNSSFKFDN